MSDKSDLKDSYIVMRHPHNGGEPHPVAAWLSREGAYLYAREIGERERDAYYSIAKVTRHD